MLDTVFSSLEFLFAFLPVSLFLYYVIPPKYLVWRNAVLFVVSLFFYGWGEPVLVFLMIGTIFIDYLCGFFIVRAISKNKFLNAKICLVTGICINLAILVFFKYSGFITSNLKRLGCFAWIPTVSVKLPIGISFYTFQAMSYIIDVYRRDASVQKNLVSFGAYVTLFPQLIAGPIVRYRDIDNMLREREHSVRFFSSGVGKFLSGLFKKVLIANVVGEMWSAYRDLPLDNMTVLGCWIGIFCYTLQIYFDFSGYSDMAVGLGRMFGFEFCENFNYPYIATSVTDFWRRWHISLSTWFRDYLYIPLGGNRNGQAKTYRNLFIVWLCTGIWHGASWNFVLWGLFYFVILVIEKAFLLRYLEKIPRWVCRVYTLFFVVIGWWLFVFEDMGSGLSYLSAMFGLSGIPYASYINLHDLLSRFLFFAVAIFGCTPIPKKIYDKLYRKYDVFKIISVIFSAALMLVAVAYLVNSSYNPFLYTNF